MSRQITDRSYALPPLGDNPSTQRQGTTPGSFANRGGVGTPWMYSSPDTAGMPGVSELTALDFAGARDHEGKTQLEVARQLKSEGKVKYVGLTHYVERAQDELADAVQESKPDFLQINYSVTQRGAEKRVFPIAKQLGVAVLANRNFDDGDLFDRVRGKALPGWAAEAGVASWAQMFLKFALSHDAVTVVIPATGKPDRQSDNLKAGVGPLLNAKQKAELVELIG